MRYLIYLIILALLIISGAVLSQLYLNEPVIVRYGEWSAAPPLSVLLGALLLAVLALLVFIRVLLWILFFPLKLSRWNRRRRSEKQARQREEAMRQLAYGNRRKVLKNLAELMPEDAAAAWWAVQVSEELDDARETKKYLQQAAAAKDEIISAAAKAKLCMRENRMTEADNILKTAGAPRASVLLARLYYEAGLARADYRAALAAALYLREELPAMYGDTVVETIRRQLQHIKSAAEAAAFWREEVAAGDKKNAQLLANYLKCLWRLGDEKAAAEGLSQALKQHPQHNAVLQAAADFGTPQQCETAFKANEQRAEKAGSRDIALLKIMTILADKLQLSGKSRLYGQMLFTLEAQQGKR